MPGEFDHKIESLGGLSNASTGYDDVHYHVLIPPNNFRESLGLLTNLVFSPEIHGLVGYLPSSDEVQMAGIDQHLR